jgi:hypothetical protein
MRMTQLSAWLDKTDPSRQGALTPLIQNYTKKSITPGQRQKTDATCKQDISASYLPGHPHSKQLRVSNNCRTNIDILTKAAINSSKHQSQDASKIWGLLQNYCTWSGLDFTDILNTLHTDGLCAIEYAIQAEDWPPVELLYNHLPCGSYAQGRVTRTRSSLISVKDRAANGLGLMEMASKQGVIAGYFKNGKAVSYCSVRSFSWDKWKTVQIPGKGKV